MLEAITFPEPVIELAVEPKTKADQDKMAIALQRLAEEDPTFRVSTDQETSQTRIAGMGELHLEVIVDRMLREFKVQANVGRPAGLVPRGDPHRPSRPRAGSCARPAARASTATRSSPSSRWSGGAATSSSRRSWAAPSRASTGRPVEEGIRDALAGGVVAGYPVIDVKATLIDGSFHEVDSSEMAFRIAGSMAAKAAVQKADPAILEPVMKVEVVTPEDFMGDVIGNLNARRGSVDGIEERATSRVIGAHVPLAEMFGYATDLRSHDPGPGHLFDGVLPLLRSPAVHRQRADRQVQELTTTRRSEEQAPWPSRSSTAPSRTSTSAPSVTSTMARRP